MQTDPETGKTVGWAPVRAAMLGVHRLVPHATAQEFAGVPRDFDGHGAPGRGRVHLSVAFRPHSLG